MWIFDDILLQGKPIIFKMIDSLFTFLKHQNCSSIQIALLPDCRPRRNTSQIKNFRYIYMVKSYGNSLQNRFLISNSRTYFNDVLWRYYSCNYNHNVNPRLDHYRKNKLKYPTLCKYCKRPGPPYKKKKPKSIFSWVRSLFGYEKKPKDKLSCCKTSCVGNELKATPKSVDMPYQEKKKSDIKKTSKLTPSSSDSADTKPTESSTNIHKKSPKKNEDEKLKQNAKKLSELCVKYNLEDVSRLEKASEDSKPTPCIDKVPCIKQQLPHKDETTGNDLEMEDKSQKNEVPLCPVPCSKEKPGKFKINLCRPCGDDEIEPVKKKKERELLNLAATKDTKTRSVLASVPKISKSKILPCKDDSNIIYPPCVSVKKPHFGDIIDDISGSEIEQETKTYEEKATDKKPSETLKLTHDEKECKTILTCDVNVTECMLKATEKLSGEKGGKSFDKEYKLSLVLSECSVKRKGSKFKLNDEESNALQSNKSNKQSLQKESNENWVSKSKILNESESRNYIFPALGPEKVNEETSGKEILESVTDKKATKNEPQLAKTENLKSTYEGAEPIKDKSELELATSRNSKSIYEGEDVSGDTSRDSRTQEPLQISEHRGIKTSQLMQSKNYNDRNLSETLKTLKDEGLDDAYTEVNRSDPSSIISMGQLGEKSTKVLLALEQATFDKQKSNKSVMTKGGLKEVLDKSPETKRANYEAIPTESIKVSYLPSEQTTSNLEMTTSQPTQLKDYYDSKVSEISKTSKDEGPDDKHAKVNHSEVSSIKSSCPLDAKCRRQLDDKSVKVLKSLDKATIEEIKSNEPTLPTGSLEVALVNSHELKTPSYEVVQIERTASRTKQPYLTSQGVTPQLQNSRNEFDETSVTVQHDALPERYDAASPKVEQMFVKGPVYLNKKKSTELTSELLKNQSENENLNEIKVSERSEVEDLKGVAHESDNKDFSKQTGKHIESSNWSQDVNKYERDESFMMHQDKNSQESYTTECPNVIHPICNVSSPKPEEMIKSPDKVKSEKNVSLPSSNQNPVPNFQLKDEKTNEVKKLDRTTKTNNTIYSPLAQTKFSLPVLKIRNLESRKKRFQTQNNRASLFKDTFYLISEKNNKLKYQKFKRVDREKQDASTLHNFATKVAKLGKLAKENKSERIYFASSKMAANNEIDSVNKERKQNMQTKSQNLINYVNKSYLKGRKRSKIEVPVINENYTGLEQNEENASKVSYELDDLKLLTYKTHEFCKIMLELVKLFSAYKSSTHALIRNKSLENLKLKQKKLEELQKTIKHLEENVQEFLQLSDQELNKRPSSSKLNKRPSGSKSKPRINFYSYPDPESEINNSFDWSKPDSSQSSSNYQNSKLTITNYQPSTSTKNFRETEDNLSNAIFPANEDEFRKTLLDLVLLFTCPDEMFNRKNQISGNRGMKRKRKL